MFHHPHPAQSYPTKVSQFFQSYTALLRMLQDTPQLHGSSIYNLQSRNNHQLNVQLVYPTTPALSLLLSSEINPTGLQIELALVAPVIFHQNSRMNLSSQICKLTLPASSITSTFMGLYPIITDNTLSSSQHQFSTTSECSRCPQGHILTKRSRVHSTVPPAPGEPNG